MSDEPLHATEKSNCTEWHCVSPGVAQPDLTCLIDSFGSFLIPGDRIHDCCSTAWLCYILHSFFQIVLLWLAELGKLQSGA